MSAPEVLADVLIEALPYIQKFSGATFVLGSDENPGDNGAITGGVHASDPANLQIHFATINGGIESHGGSGPEGGPFGESPKMLELKGKLAKFATSNATVLLLGENGTGKEVAARWIRELSPRKSGPFKGLHDFCCRVEQRRRAVGLEIVEGVRERREVRAEGVPLMKRRIKSEDSQLVVTGAELREQRVEGVASHLHFRSEAHAAAHVNEDGETERRSIVGADGDDRTKLAVVPHFEITRREARHGPTAPVADRSLDRDEIDRALECLVDGLCLSPRRRRAREYGTDRRRDSELTHHSRHRIPQS